MSWKMAVGRRKGLPSVDLRGLGCVVGGRGCSVMMEAWRRGARLACGGGGSADQREDGGGGSPGVAMASTACRARRRTTARRRGGTTTGRRLLGVLGHGKGAGLWGMVGRELGGVG